MEADKALQTLERATKKKDEPGLDVSQLPPPGPGSLLAFYHPTQKSFIFCADTADGGVTWVDLPRERYKAQLLARGLSMKHAETLVCHAEINERIQYFGPVAGRAPGVYVDNGSRIVVDRGPRLLNPEPGNWDTLRCLIEGLFHEPVNETVSPEGDTSPESPSLNEGSGSGGPESGSGVQESGNRIQESGNRIQESVFHGWVQSSVRALRAGLRQSQQVMVICGPSDCGKSLLQHLITHFLGGRSAKAHRYFSGQTTFNGDLMGAEHLIIEDDYMPSDMKSRLALGAQFKQFAVGTEAVSFNAKFQQAVNLKAYFRISVTTNDEPENLMVLPPINGDVGDKLIILRAKRFPMPMPTLTAEDKAVFWEKLYNEIPHYLWWLLNEFQLPEELQDRRYGVTSWKHKTVLAQVDAASPEEALWDLMERHFFTNTGSREPVNGRAEEIRALLLSSGDDFVRRQAERLLPLSHQMWTYLKRIEKRGDGRVRQRRLTKARVWTLFPRIE